MDNNIRTDLAVEARELYKEGNAGEVPGVEVEDESSLNVKVTRVKIISQEGQQAMGKPMGTYITIEADKLRDRDMDVEDEVSRVLAKEMVALLKVDKDALALVVGLGNWNVTPDALGPRVISKLMVTKHLLELKPEYKDSGLRPVCAITPGVLGTTGMETSDIIEGIIEKIKPDFIIAIDALASRRMNRISTSIQIADTGINPGSGIGNYRSALSQDVLGIPVIAIGVPTVVDAGTMANDTIDMLIETLMKQSKGDTQFYSVLKSMDRDEKYNLITEVISPYVGKLMVTPKDIDAVIDDVSRIIANGINISLHENVTLEDVNRYVN
ncbi:GPR endopeptidase [Mahella australiensis]|uniref:Germination protease n=1 Tax=Mahella australiensis (strain DSM 15567 / CIP 107919 / 50-1 BON) TaxID=697281 RepID=F3ZZM0_MAHA5|nr:GPR endopeptidase [Mahella australiensis]AEE96846.1 spore protease [Mahella australiensis 50-1 BON]